MKPDDSIPENRDAVLLSKIALRDKQAFSKLYDLYSGVLYSISYAILRNEDDAKDVLQDVYIKIWERAHVFDVQLGKPQSWLVTLTRNTSIDRLRAKKRKMELLELASRELAVLNTSSSVTLDKIINTETAVMVRTAIEKLPLEQKQAIEMAYFGGLTQAEIASVMKQPLGTVKARIRRGMIHLRNSLRIYL